MEIIPEARATRYEQLEPGELFLLLEHGTYALKTRRSRADNREDMVVLGPSFLDGGGPYLLGWEAMTVLSFGRHFSVLLPSEPAAWSTARQTPSDVWLAVGEEHTFVCANGGPSPHRYVNCFINLDTGEIVEGRSPGHVLYTSRWEIAVLGTSHPPRTILSYPLAEGR
jgi:hypothetical protein